MTPPDTPEHRPVMLAQVLRCLRPRAGEAHADGTVGAAGHAVHILAKLGESGFLLGVDRDPHALEIADRRLAAVGFPYRLVRGVYSELREHLISVGRRPDGALDGLLLDLGVSSMQLDRPERGFSFLKEGPLDMRMSAGEGEAAAEFLRRVPRAELEEVLRELGEERFARRIAREVVRAREEGALETTTDLARLVERILPRKDASGIHPATRTFQAIRIAVNRELEELSRVLRDVDRLLRPGGRIVVLSYHSLEDRIVKRWGRSSVREGLFRWLETKALRPEPQEIDENPRARSARLRALARTTHGQTPL